MEVAKIADFGISWLVDQSQSVQTYPWRWTAPEVGNDIENTTTRSDVFSFGVLIYEALRFGELPYRSYNNGPSLVSNIRTKVLYRI